MKKNGILLNFKNHQDKRKFLQNKKLVESFGRVTNDEAPKQQNHNEAILLGIDERFSSLLYLLNSYEEEFIKKQIRQQLEDVSTIRVNSRNKVSLLILNTKKKTARIKFVKEEKLAEAIGRGMLTIGVSKYVLCLPVEKRLRTCRNCCQMGHWEGRCINKSVCVKCAGPHHSKTCASEDFECHQCGNNHIATDPRCKARRNKRKKIREEITEKLLKKWKIPNKRLNARTNATKKLIEKNYQK